MGAPVGGGEPGHEVLPVVHLHPLAPEPALQLCTPHTTRVTLHTAQALCSTQHQEFSSTQHKSFAPHSTKRDVPHKLRVYSTYIPQEQHCHDGNTWQIRDHNNDVNAAFSTGVLCIAPVHLAMPGFANACMLNALLSPKSTEQSEEILSTCIVSCNTSSMPLSSWPTK